MTEHLYIWPINAKEKTTWLTKTNTPVQSPE
jgi:squalene cyclase